MRLSAVGYLDAVPEAQTVHAVDEAKEQAHGGGGETTADEGVFLGRLQQAGVLAHLKINLMSVYVCRSNNFWKNSHPIR